MRLYRELEGNEWRCGTCGHVDYGDGFVPLDRPVEEDGRVHNREPSHGGRAL